MNSGHTTKHRRRKTNANNAANAALALLGRTKPKGKAGRKRKQNNNPHFKKKHGIPSSVHPQQGVSTRATRLAAEGELQIDDVGNNDAHDMASALAADAPKRKRRSKVTSTRKSTRSNTTISDQRHRTAPELFIATHATSDRKGHNKKWHKDIVGKQKQEVETAKVGCTEYKKMWLNSNRQFYVHQFIAEDIPPDRQNDVVPAVLDISAEDIEKFVRNSLQSKCDTALLQGVFRKLGLVKGSNKRAVKTTNVVDGIHTILDYHFRNYGDEKRADIIAEALFNGQLFGREIGNKIIMKCVKSVTNVIFSPVNLLEVMDTTSGLNDSAMDAIAKIEDKDGQTNAKQGQGMLPRRHRLSSHRKLGDRFGHRLLNIKHKSKSSHGEVVFIDEERLLRVIISAYGLKDKAAREGITICITGDGAEICGTAKAAQTAIGFKAADIDSIDPITKEKAFTYQDEEGKVYYKDTQSTNHCYPFCICLSNETKSMVYKTFGPKIEWLKGVAKNGLPGNGSEPPIAPGMEICAPADMSFQWKLIGRGGACKVSNFFCMYCECESNDMFTKVEGEHRCSYCKERGKERCPHRAVNTEEELIDKGNRYINYVISDHRARHPALANASKKAILTALLPTDRVECYAGYGVASNDDSGERIRITEEKYLIDDVDEDGTINGHLNDYCKHLQHIELSEIVTKHSNLRYHPNEYNKKDIVTNIEFERGNDASKDNEFHAHVLSDLRLRGYDANTIPRDKDDRVTLLKERLLLGKVLQRLLDALEEDEKAKKYQLLGPGQCPTDVLHGHMRMVEKFVQQLLVIVMRDYNNGSAREWKQMISDVENVVNRKILGRSDMHCDDKSGWHFPLHHEKKKQLADIKLSNPEAKLFRTNLEELVKVCTARQSPTLVGKWVDACRLFNEVSELLDSKQHFDKDDAYNFQAKADAFCDVYIKLTGRDGMTNYYHNLHAGHFMYFLLKYGNLYRLSQQGWENINGQMKRSYHSNTQKGGGRGGTSKLVPVMAKMVRSMLWRFGYMKDMFKSLGYKSKVDVTYDKVEPHLKHRDSKGNDLHTIAIQEFSDNLFKFDPIPLTEEDLEEQIQMIEELDRINEDDVVAM